MFSFFITTILHLTVTLIVKTAAITLGKNFKWTGIVLDHIRDLIY